MTNRASDTAMMTLGMIVASLNIEYYRKNYPPRPRKQPANFASPRRRGASEIADNKVHIKVYIEVASCAFAHYIGEAGLRGALGAHIPGALSILKGAVPDRARGLGHMAPTYFRREPGIERSDGRCGSALTPVLTMRLMTMPLRHGV